MERTELLVGDGVIRLKAGRLSRPLPKGEWRRVPDYRMLWKGTALMRFAHSTTTNSFLSNGDELRLQSHHVVAFPMENRPPMTTRDGATDLPNLNEGCKATHGGQRRTPQTRGPAVAEIKDGSPP
jgi:hypothetical protein